MWNKIIPAALLSGLLFFGCKNEPGTAAAPPVAIPENLGGYWVNDAWWQELQSTKSPMKAAQHLNGVAAAIFHQDSTKWLADMSYNWHEGHQLTLRTKDGGLQLYDPKNAAIQQYMLVPHPDGTMSLDSLKMVRLGDAYTGFNAIASTLVGGQYEMGGKQVIFNPNGTILGLDDYIRYEMLLDYVSEDVQADQLQLSKEGRTPDFYAFKLEGNHLQLYPIVDVGSKDAFKYEVAKLKYELVKK